MKVGSLYPALIGAGVLFAFYASGAPSLNASKNPTKQESAFFLKLEEAYGNYRVVSGLLDAKCSEGPLRRFSGESRSLLLGTNIYIRGIDQPESVEKDGECEIRHLAKSSGMTVTSVDQFYCKQELKKTVTTKLEIIGKQIRYRDGTSNCLYERTAKVPPP